MVIGKVRLGSQVHQKRSNVLRLVHEPWHVEAGEEPLRVVALEVDLTRDVGRRGRCMQIPFLQGSFQLH